MPRLVTAFAAAITLLTPAQAAPGEMRTFSADYSVTLYGLPVGKARFDSTFDGDRFAIKGSIASSGIARLIEKTNGTTRVQGRIGDDAVLPQSYAVAYVSGDEKESTTIRYSGNKVVETVNTPKPKKRGKDWVPLGDKHLRGALDPLSATLIPAANPAKVCDRTIRFYDGELRADLKLSHAGTGPIRGFEGAAVTCNVQFIPLAGYRQGRKQIEFLKNKSRISISFMPLGDTGLHAPVAASIDTQVGTVRVTARKVDAR
jgi:hypothetical protein